MKPVWYGPFARFADWNNGVRDGRKRIPRRPSQGERSPNRITTGHRESLIRRAQDAFEHERLVFEARRRRIVQRVASARANVDSAKAALARAQREVPVAAVPLTEAELNRRRPGEERHDAEFIRLRRRREHVRRQHEVAERVRAEHHAVGTAEAELAAASAEDKQRLVVARARVCRIHEHTHNRLDRYRRTLARWHRDGSWVNAAMSSVDPAIPGWVLDEQPPPRPKTERDIIKNPPPPPRTSFIPIGRPTVFGSRRPDAHIVVPGYGIAPAHFTIERSGAKFRLQNHSYGHGRGLYVAGRPIRARSFVVGDHFDFGDYQFRFVEGGVERRPLGKADLVVSKLNARKGTKTLLEDMSLVQLERTVLAILGPSGAGKTSLFKALMGEVETGSGQLFFRNLNLRDDAGQIREMLGYVPQQPDLHNSLTVERLLSYTDELRSPDDGGRADRVAAVRQELALLKPDQLVSTLSGGQQKRVSIAMEMLSTPALLMLDEPTSGLDTGLDRQVMEILQRYAKPAPPDATPAVDDWAQPDGPTVIVITHSTEHLDLADQVLVVATNGRPVYLGPPADALATLGAGDYAELMARLGEDGAEGDREDETTKRTVKGKKTLAREYAESRFAAKAAAAALAAAAEQGAATEKLKRGARGPWSAFKAQLPILVRRQVAIIRRRGTTKNQDERKLRDRAQAVVTVALPVLIAVLGAALAAGVSGKHGLGLGNSGPGPANTAANGALSLLITLCALAGQALTYGDLVAEHSIIKREFRTGTVTAAVVLAKWLVFALVAVIQAALVVVVFTWIRPGPAFSVLLWPKLELFVDLATTMISAMSLGLLISAWAKKLEQAVPIATLAVILQVALNGVAANLPDLWLFNTISWVLPARWGLATAASSVDLKGIGRGANQDWLWGHTVGHWAMNMAILGALTTAFVWLAVLVLNRRLNKPE